MPSFEHSSSTLDRHSGPAVLLLSDDLELLTQTPQTDAYLRALLPTDAERAPIPAGAYNVAAQRRPRSGHRHTPSVGRVHVRDGLWVTLPAGRIDKRSADAASIAVSIEPTPADGARRVVRPGRRSQRARISNCSHSSLPVLILGTRTAPVRVRAHRARSPQVGLRKDRRQQSSGSRSRATGLT